MEEKILEILKEMDDAELVTLWNEYCYQSNNYDDEIFTFDTLEEMIENSNEGTIYWLNRFFYGSDEFNKESGANPNRNYFQFNGYANIVSFDYVGFNEYANKFSDYIDENALIDYIIENENSLYNDDIQAILDEEENEED